MIQEIFTFNSNIFKIETQISQIVPGPEMTANGEIPWCGRVAVPGAELRLLTKLGAHC